MPSALQTGPHTRVLPHLDAPWLAARLHPARLDDELARGARPSSSAALAARAAMVTRTGHRRVVARGLNAAIRRARQPVRATLSTHIPVSPEATGDAREMLVLLARRIVAPGPVGAGGVVLAWRLLTDGTGPLYGYADRPGDLRRAAEHALRACDGV